MRHHDSNRKFGRERNQRTALLRSLAVSLIGRGRIRTTEAKAKELRPFVEKLVTMAQKENLSSRRLVGARLGNAKEAKKLFDEIAPRYKERAGGYTRVVKLPVRQTDAARMAIIEFV